MNSEIKQLKLESIFKDAYIERYGRLGYDVVSQTESVEDGKNYTVIVFGRDRDMPSYERLAEIEGEVDELCRRAKEEADLPDEVRDRRKIVLYALFIAGVVLMAAGVALVVAGLIESMLYMALGGWAAAVAGAVLVMVWGFLREKWCMRRIDAKDMRVHPGFGCDIYSRKIEERLEEADRLIGAGAH